MIETHTGTKITDTHRAKLAYVYIRQSTPGQLTHHPESTSRQYQLVERAEALGWPAARVQIIDEDLAKSGAQADQRLGFQHLLAEISLGHVGLVLSLEAARLARNCSDWYRLLELGSIFGAIIADAEFVYDPRQYHDRLWLGLAGMMSEAELHQIHLRLHAGQRHKAERGALCCPCPRGWSACAVGRWCCTRMRKCRRDSGWSLTPSSKSAVHGASLSICAVMTSPYRPVPTTGRRPCRSCGWQPPLKWCSTF